MILIVLRCEILECVINRYPVVSLWLWTHHFYAYVARSVLILNCSRQVMFDCKLVQSPLPQLTDYFWWDRDHFTTSAKNSSYLMAVNGCCSAVPLCHGLIFWCVYLFWDTVCKESRFVCDLLEILYVRGKIAGRWEARWLWRPCFSSKSGVVAAVFYACSLFF